MRGSSCSTSSILLSDSSTQIIQAPNRLPSEHACSSIIESAKCLAAISNNAAQMQFSIIDDRQDKQKLAHRSCKNRHDCKIDHLGLRMLSCD